MKKLLFVLAFTFIGQQAFSQIVIVTLYNDNTCSSSQVDLTISTPTGETTTCISQSISSGGLQSLNDELNIIANQGYKLVSSTTNSSALVNYVSTGGSYIWGLTIPHTWIFAIPWSASGLEEVATTLKSFIISPNPANTFVDISLDYSLKGESEVVFISEAGYISHKESIGAILKNEKYNIDISKIPAGKYLVTIVNGKTYTTPQKLIVL